MYPNERPFQPQFQIVRALFSESGTYNDMSLRVYNADFRDPNLADRFLSATNGGQVISGDTLAGVAGDFLVPSSQPFGVAKAPNGWGNKMLRFIMHVVVKQPNYTGDVDVAHKMVQGYTDFVGVDPNGNVAPDMRLYINSVMTYTETTIADNYGRRTRPRWAGKEQIISGTPRLSPGQPYSPTRLMRPTDLLDSMTAINACELGAVDAAPFGGFSGGDMAPNMLEDYTTNFATTHVVKSDRSLTRAPHFVSSVFSAWRDAYREHQDEDLGVADPTTFYDVYSRARGKVLNEGTVEGDPLLSHLKRETTFSQNEHFTYGELRSICPEIDDPSVTTVMFEREVVRQQTHSPQGTPPGLFPERAQRGDSEGWNNSNTETIWATVLANSVPSIMLDSFLTFASFNVTNQTTSGMPVVTPLGMNTIMGCSLPDVDLQRFMETFLSRIETEVIRSLSRENLIDYNITMEVDTMGDTRIAISIGGEPQVMYTVPSFSDASFSPVLAPNANYVGQMSNQFKSFIEDVGSRLFEGGMGQKHGMSQQTNQGFNF